MIEEIVDKLREKKRRRWDKKSNEYTISEILQCREKSWFIREDKIPNIVVTDVVRQGWISSFVRDSIQRVLEQEGWWTDVKYTKDIGDYRLTGFADGAKGDNLVMIKCPMRPVKGKKLPDVHLLEAQMLLYLSNADECLVWYLHKEEFREMKVTEAMLEVDIIWFIERINSPYYERECASCFYYDYCDIMSKKV